MAYTDLSVAESDFGPELPFMVKMVPRYRLDYDLPDATVSDVFRREAYAEMTADIGYGIGRPYTIEGAPALFDAIYVDHAYDLRRTLALLQIAMAYESQDGGEGSLMRDKAKRYRKEYEARKAGFSGLIRVSGHSTVRNFTVSL